MQSSISTHSDIYNLPIMSVTKDNQTIDMVVEYRAKSSPITLRKAQALGLKIEKISHMAVLGDTFIVEDMPVDVLSAPTTNLAERKSH